MVGIVDFETLKLEWTAYSHRADLNAQYPTFTQLTEARIYRDGLLQEMETELAAINTVDGSYVLPATYRRMRQVSYQRNARGYKLTSASRDAIVNFQGQTTPPEFYNIRGFVLDIAPFADTVDFDLVFYQALDSLTGANDNTNAILLRYPGLFLFGGLFEIGRFTRDTDLQQWADEAFNRELTAANADADEARSGEAPQTRPA